MGVVLAVAVTMAGGPTLSAAQSLSRGAALDVYRLAGSCAWIQRNSGARNPKLAARHVGILQRAGVPWRRCLNLRYPMRTICWWLAEAGRLDAHVRRECSGHL